MYNYVMVSQCGKEIEAGVRYNIDDKTRALKTCSSLVGYCKIVDTSNATQFSLVLMEWQIFGYEKPKFDNCKLPGETL